MFIRAYQRPVPKPVYCNCPASSSLLDYRHVLKTDIGSAHQIPPPSVVADVCVPRNPGANFGSGVSFPNS